MAQVQCEITIIKLINLEFFNHLPRGNLFIRYYVVAGSGRRIRVDSREIQSTREPYWNDKSSFDCFMASDTMKESICASNVVFELRWRRHASAVFGIVGKSKLLGRAEVSLKDDMSTERLVSLVTKKGLMEGLKTPMLSVRMSIKVSDLQAIEKRTKGKGAKEWSKCRCESCMWIGSEDVLFVAANVPASMLNSW